MIKPSNGISYNRSHYTMKDSVFSLPLIAKGDMNDYANRSGHPTIVNNTVPWTEDEQGACLLFGGTNDYLDCDNSPTAGLPALTVEVWVWIQTNTVSYMIIEDGTAYNTNTFFLSINDGNPNCLIYDGSGHDEVISPDKISVQAWHHVVMTWEAGSRVAVYADGEFKAAGTSGTQRDSPLLSSPNRNLTIGGRPASPLDQDFSGLLGGVNIYDRKLTPVEIKSLYEHPWDAWKRDDTDLWTATFEAGVTFNPIFATNSNIML